MALTVLFVPESLDSGGTETFFPRFISMFTESCDDPHGSAWFKVEVEGLRFRV